MVKYEKKNVAINETSNLIIEGDVNERENKSVLIYNNGDTDMTVTILGSPDNKLWFIVTEDVPIIKSEKRAFTEFKSIYSYIRVTGKTAGGTTLADGWILFEGTVDECKHIIGVN